MPLYFCTVVSIFFFLSFLAYSQWSQIGCLPIPYFYTLSVHFICLKHVRHDAVCSQQQLMLLHYRLIVNKKNVTAHK